MRICFTGMNMSEKCMCVNNRNVREDTKRVCNYVSPDIIDFYQNYYGLYHDAIIKKYQTLTGTKPIS